MGIIVYNNPYILIKAYRTYKDVKLMGEQISTLVKIPISDIVDWVRTKHSLPSVLKDFHLEEEKLVLCFAESEDLRKEEESELVKNHARKRRAHRRRNRMKTRGWDVVARITNSKGQYCAVYKPFVEALQNPKLTFEEQKKIVEGILKSNRNRPAETSIQYFLENTLEYLQKQRGQTSQDKVS
jgi:uncharacterized protein (DUF433 family)